ncbi:MAG: type II secretion system protein GspK [Candidatus Omnitrophota bacterium]|nr:type II secretion system protein GspK [Candidatus Omnitrophota bacterium]
MVKTVTKKSGTILITTLWILTILSILAVGIGFRVSVEARLSKYNMDKVRAVYLAKAGIIKAEELLSKDSSAEYDTVRECGITLPSNIVPAGGEDALKGIFTGSLGDGRFEVGYEEEGKPYYGMMDEDRKININKADQAMLTTLLGKDNEDVAASIVNWRGMARVPGGGAWDDDYGSLNPSYKCKHANFSVIEELMLVKGMTPELFESIKDYVTVYGDDNKLSININTATRRVMLACGLGENLVASIMNIRNGIDKVAGTKDDGLVQDITPEATGKWDITSDERNALNNFTTKSNYFRIESKGAIDKSKISAKIVCVIDKGTNKLKYYREY